MGEDRATSLPALAAGAANGALKAVFVGCVIAPAAGLFLAALEVTTIAGQVAYRSSPSVRRGVQAVGQFLSLTHSS
jgi:hypothetical protein